MARAQRECGYGCGRTFRGSRPEQIGHWECNVQARHVAKYVAPPPADVATRPQSRHLYKRILVIPDTQLKPGVPMGHMTWASKYAVAKRPDVIVHIGDAADMESLSSYDKGKKSFEGRRYKLDVDSARRGMEMFQEEIAKAADYKPRQVLTLGNHEDRITRAIENSAELEGVIGIKDLGLEALGWEVHNFLEIVTVEGVEFCHYFISGSMGRPASSAAVVLRERQCSAIQGHNQKFDLVVHPRTGAIAMMVGAFYQHSEAYLTAQGQATRLQLVMLNEVRAGRFDPMLISMDYLRRRFS